MLKPLILAAFLAASALDFRAQDPTKVAPDAYRLQFDNEYVRVLRVHYAPHSKIPLHDHSKWPAAYVYLNDSGPIRFSHAHWDDPVLTRPATKARSFRLSPTTQAEEQHEVENPGDTPSDFLRIEFKTLVQGKGLSHGRYPPDTYPEDKNFSKMKYENEKLRVTRLTIAPGKIMKFSADADRPALLVRVSEPPQDNRSPTLPLGETTWLKPDSSLSFENRGRTPIEFLRFDFKPVPAVGK